MIQNLVKLIIKVLLIQPTKHFHRPLLQKLTQITRSCYSMLQAFVLKGNDPREMILEKSKRNDTLNQGSAIAKNTIYGNSIYSHSQMIAIKLKKKKSIYIHLRSFSVAFLVHENIVLFAPAVTSFPQGLHFHSTIHVTEKAWIDVVNILTWNRIT